MGSRYGLAMRMTIRQGEGWADVWVFLTEAEADGVARALRSRLDGEPGYQGPGYHLHLEDDAGELTLAVLDGE
jgi:hypothetical protein